MDKRPLPDWKLERYLLGELPDEQINEIDRLLEHDNELMERIRALRESDRSILEKYPAETMADRIRQRALFLEKDRRPGRGKAARPAYRVIYSLAAVATAAVVIFLASPIVIDRNPGRLEAPVPEDIRLKGMEPGIYLYRKTADGASERLRDGDPVKEGDLLQTAYSSLNHQYGSILSLDGRWTVTVHYPPEGRGSTALELDRKTVLGRSYRLDDAPLFERFFFITSPMPIDVPSLVARVKALSADEKNGAERALSLRPGERQYSILVRKGERT